MQPVYQGVPNNSGKPSEDSDLYGGKFQNVEDLETAYKDLESRLGEQGNELGAVRQEAGQLRDLLTTQTSEPTSGEVPEQPDMPMVGSQPDWDALVADPNQQAKAIIDTAVHEAVSTVRNLYEQEQSNDQRRDAFFATNPDLAPFADNIVASTNTRLAQENPNMQEDQFFAKVAEEARGEVAQLKTKLGVPQDRQVSRNAILSEGAQTPPGNPMIPASNVDGIVQLDEDQRQDEIDQAVMDEMRLHAEQKINRTGNILDRRTDNDRFTRRR